MKVDDRIGSTAIPIPPEKIAAIVITNQGDSPSTVAPPDSDTQAIADHLIDFFKQEVSAGRMTNKLGPLQAGIGNIANAVMCGLIDSPFEDLTMYSEVLQDSTFDLIDAGKLSFASGSSITLSGRRNADVFGNLEGIRTNWSCVRRKSPTIPRLCAAWASLVSTPRWNSTYTAM